MSLHLHDFMLFTVDTWWTVCITVGFSERTEVCKKCRVSLPRFRSAKWECLYASKESKMLPTVTYRNHQGLQKNCGRFKMLSKTYQVIFLLNCTNYIWDNWCLLKKATYHHTKHWHFFTIDYWLLLFTALYSIFMQIDVWYFWIHLCFAVFYCTYLRHFVQYCIYSHKSYPTVWIRGLKITSCTLWDWCRIWIDWLAVCLKQMTSNSVI